MQQNRRGSSGWIGWLIFIVLVFGSRFLPPIAAWLSQVTGLPITTPILIAAVVGLGVVANIVSSILRASNRPPGPIQPHLPTASESSFPPQPISPPMPGPPARAGTSSLPSARLPTGEQGLPGPPRFEPILDPRVLTFGIIGLFIVGGFFFLALLLSGAL